MVAFHAIDAERRPPPATLVLPPSCFADTWEDKPRGEQCAGLRLIADADMTTARAQAAKESARLLRESGLRSDEVWYEWFNDALMRHIVGRTLCDPNDVNSDFEVIAASPEDMVREFFTAEGVRLVFDAWERMRIAHDPTQPSDDDPSCIVDLLPNLAKLDATDAARVRRLLSFCMDTLASVSD